MQHNQRLCRWLGLLFKTSGTSGWRRVRCGRASGRTSTRRRRTGKWPRRKRYTTGTKI